MGLSRNYQQHTMDWRQALAEADARANSMARRPAGMTQAELERAQKMRAKLEAQNPFHYKRMPIIDMNEISDPVPELDARAAIAAP